MPCAEAQITAEGGGTWNADLTYVDQATGQEYLIDVAIVNVDSDTSVSSWHRLGDTERLLEAEERARRRNRVVQGYINGSGNMKIFVPFVVSSFGGFGPAARDLLTKAYAVARASPGRYFLGANHPTLHTTWNTMTAPTFWDARISVACTQADAEFQGRIIARDQLMAWPTQGRQPNPDPNHAPYAPSTERPAQRPAASRVSAVRTSRAFPPALGPPNRVGPADVLHGDVRNDGRANAGSVITVTTGQSGPQPPAAGVTLATTFNPTPSPLLSPAPPNPRVFNARGVNNLPAWMGARSQDASEAAAALRLLQVSRLRHLPGAGQDVGPGAGLGAGPGAADAMGAAGVVEGNSGISARGRRPGPRTGSSEPGDGAMGRGRGALSRL